MGVQRTKDRVEIGLRKWIWNNRGYKWNIIFFILSGYCIFLFLKIEGYFDYSSKYHIQQIICNQTFDNQLFVLDNDDETTWGLLEEHYPNEGFGIIFSKEISINKIEIENKEKDRYPSADVEFYVSMDGENWIKCENKLNELEDGTNQYLMKQTYQAKCMRITYNEKKPGFWPITELRLQ